jgi:hypothetical protein
MTTTSRSILQFACSSAALLTASAAFGIPKTADFDGDGRPDIAIGAPHAGIGGNVMLLNGDGSSDGFLATGIRVSQDDGAIDDLAESGDMFGHAIAWGDFDDDGFSDLVVGVPGEDVPGITNIGAVHVLYGGVPFAADDDFFFPGQTALDGGGTTRGMGYALAVGDFNNDGVDDLAVGGRTSRVHILYGVGGDGLQFGFNHSLTPAGMGFTGHTADDFGTTLVAGDLDCDGDTDLAIGSPGFNPGGKARAGRVYVAYAQTGGFWQRFETHQANTPQADAAFGAALAMGNFNFDANGSVPFHMCNDLAIGAPGQNVGTAARAGQVFVMKGSTSGLVRSSLTAFNQDTGSIPGTAETDDAFGKALAVTRIDGDSLEDLAVGVPGEDDQAGVVCLLKGTTTGSGLTTTGSVMLKQGSGGIPGAHEGGLFDGDSFGAAIGGTLGILAIGAPFDEIDGHPFAGWVAVLKMDSGSFGNVLAAASYDSRNFGVSLADGQEFGTSVLQTLAGR